MSIYSRNINDKNLYMKQDKTLLSEFMKYLNQQSLNNKFTMQQTDESFTGYIKSVRDYFSHSGNDYVKDIVIDGAIQSAFNLIKSSKINDTKKSSLIDEIYTVVSPETIKDNVDIKDLETLATNKANRFIVKSFLKNGYSLKNNSQILISSIHSGDKDFFDLAIKNNADVNGPDNADKAMQTPLGWKPSHLVKERNSIHEYMIDVLLKKGANINRFQNTPSHYLVPAVSSKDRDLVEILIKKGIQKETEWNNIKMKDYIKKNSPDFYNIIYETKKSKQCTLKY